MNEIKIRDYTPRDFDQVRANLEQAEMFYEPTDSAQMLAQLTNDGNLVLIAEVDDQIIGSMFVLKSWGPFFFRLVVNQDHRKQGIGTKLLEAGEEKLADQGFSEVHILVDSDDEKVQAFYHNRGYGKFGTYRWMAKDLDR